jgi:hypothetical protein
MVGRLPFNELLAQLKGKTGRVSRRRFLKQTLAAVGVFSLLRSATPSNPVPVVPYGETRLASAASVRRPRTVWAWLRMFQVGNTFPIPTSEAAYRANLQHIDVAMPVNGGTLLGDGTWLQEPWKLNPQWPQDLPNMARETGHLYMPTVFNDREGVRVVMSDPELRLVAADNLVKLATEERFDAPWDGVLLDLEGIPYEFRRQMSEFLRVLADRLRTAGLRVGVSVGGRTRAEIGDGYELAVVGEVADYVDLRCYGYREPPPLSISPYWWLEGCVRYALEEGIRPEQLLLGLGLFSKYWPDSSRRYPVAEITYESAMQLIEEAGATLGWVAHNAHGAVREHFAKIGAGEVWVHDKDTIRFGLDLADQYNLLGISPFAAGMGNAAMWEVIGRWRIHAAYMPIFQNSPLLPGNESPEAVIEEPDIR